MDDSDDLPIEDELRKLRPAAASKRLENRIADMIAPSCPPARYEWWRRLGFVRPTAAFGWGLASPAMAAAITLLIVRMDAREPSPSPLAQRLMTGGEPRTGRASIRRAPEMRNAKTASVLHEALDEGVMPDGDDGLVRQVRYRSTDRVQWRNPSTGAEWEVSYPREDVLFVPISTE